ncbi:serine protease [Inhella inkyongensis]|uniref:Serine protease n=1 Tax=Inhella inkyongensis TaxID=392593 RepID=A0A840S234_9BURK|nr:S8 family peptidase [Inhella inkyongensis]MBB5204365.1 serine protease [Inhella inkyongensis]
MSIAKNVPSRILMGLLVSAGLASVAQAGGANVSAERGAFTDRLIIKYRMEPAAASQGGLAGNSGIVPPGLARLAQAQGLSLKEHRTTGLGAKVYTLGKWAAVSDLAALAAQMKNEDDNIEYAEPDRRMYAMMTPNDTNYSSLWGLQGGNGGMRANTAWDSYNGTGVVVAVLDTGIRASHPDLVGQTVAGYDMIADTFVSNDGTARDADPSDPGDWATAGQCGTGEPASNSSWHGTHVAGTIAAKGNNSLGVIGVAYGAKVQAVRVLGRCGGYTSDIADAMIWASGGTVSGVPANATPAKVINMSLGGGGACDTTSQNAINSARSRGTVVVVAAGNENQNASNSNPANCSGVVTVAAVGPTGGRAYYSNYGTVVDVAAPGGDMSASSSNGILSTLNAGTTGPGADNYAYYQGTSMATPHVAGLAALMLQAKPTATPDQIEAALKSSARAFPATCSGCGTGIIDAPAAITAILGGTTPPPTGTTMNETESNNTTGTANTVSTSNTTVNGSLSTTTDTDYFKVNLPAGKTLTATLNGGAKDYDLYIYNSNGTQIASSENGAGQADTASVTNTGTTTIARYVRVKYYSGGSGTYTLNLKW